MDRLEALRELKRDLEFIVSHAPPDDDSMQEGDDGYTDWGLTRSEVIEAAYENVLCVAEQVLEKARALIAQQEADNG